MLKQGGGVDIFGRRGASDEPTSIDSLGVGHHVAGLAEFACTCETPLTIALQGDWGSGKTTFLRLLEEELTRTENGSSASAPGRRARAVVTFDAWQAAFAADESATFTALVATISSEIQRTAPPAVMERVTASAERLKACVLSWAPRSGLARHGVELAGNALIPGGGAVASEVWSALLNAGGDDLPAVTGGALVRRAFHDLIKQRFGAASAAPDGPQERLIIFVDNLDRLRPARAVEIMECLKALLDSTHCVFVVAIDFDVVVQGLSDKYASMDAAKARAFFDKIIQLPFQIPVNSYQIDGLLLDLMPELRGDANRDTLAQVEAVLDGSVGKNPRAIKRMANSYRLLGYITEAGESQAIDVGMLAQIALQIAHPDVHRHLDNDADLAQAVSGLEDIHAAQRNGDSGVDASVRLAEEWTDAVVVPLTEAQQKDPEVSAAARRARQTSEQRLARLLRTLAAIYGTDGGWDGERFSATWRLVAVTSVDANQDPARSSGMSRRAVDEGLEQQRVSPALAAATRSALDSWEATFPERGGELHAWMTDHRLRVSISMPGRARPRSVMRFYYGKDPRTVRVEISGKNLTGGPKEHDAFFRRLSDEHGLVYSYRYDQYELRELTPEGVLLLAGVVPDLIDPVTSLPTTTEP